MSGPLVIFATSIALFGQEDRAGPPLGDTQPEQPRFSFKLTELHPGLNRGADRWMVGRIHVFKPGKNKSASVKPHQVIEVVMTDNESFFAQFGVDRPDLNCDGFPDLEIHQHGGAKWGYDHVWLYHPATGTFVPTPLTRQFATLSHANYRIDPKTRKLHLQQFYGAQLFEHIYHITPERLIFESKQLVKK